MENKNNFPSKFVEPFLTSLEALNRSSIYIFPNDNNKCYKYLRGAFTVFCFLMFGISMNVSVCGLFVGQLDIYKLSYTIPVYLSIQFAFVRCVFTIIKKRDIRSLILQLGSMWRTENLTEEQLNKKNTSLKWLNFLQKLYLWIHWPGIMHYITAPLFETFFRKLILRQECEFLFPMPCSFPYDPKRSWTVYLITYSFELFSVVTFMNLYIAYDTLFITLCSHLITEFTILQEDLLHTEPVLNREQEVDDENLTLQNPNIKVIIKRHQKLIAMSHVLDGIYNVMIFVNILVITVSACFFAFASKILRGPLEISKNIVALFASLIPVFSISYYGEIIAELSGGIGDSAYNSLWYNGNMQYKRAVLFIIMRSQKPCHLTALGYAPISLNTFTRILSTTWSYFSLINTMYEQEN